MFYDANISVFCLRCTPKRKFFQQNFRFVLKRVRFMKLISDLSAQISGINATSYSTSQ